MSVRQERQADATTAGTIGENSDAGSSHNGSDRCMFSGSVLQTLLAAQEQTTSSDGATSDASGFEQQLFAKLDADGDGTINKSEFEVAFTAAHENTSRPEAWFDKHGDDSVGGGEEASSPHRGHQGHHGGFVRHALARLDGDGDGDRSGGTCGGTGHRVATGAKAMPSGFHGERAQNTSAIRRDRRSGEGDRRAARADAPRAVRRPRQCVDAATILYRPGRRPTDEVRGRDRRETEGSTSLIQKMPGAGIEPARAEAHGVSSRGTSRNPLNRTYPMRALL